MQKYVVTKVGLNDIRVLKQIEVDCGLSPWSIGAYELELLRADSVMLKALAENGQSVGFLVGRIPSDGSSAEIYNLGIAPPIRREGIGSMLLERFRGTCIDRRVGTVWLEVRAGNQGAIAFYRSHGFHPKGVRQNFYSDPVEDAILMTLSVSGANQAKL